MDHNLTNIFSQREMYQLFLFLQSLDDLKRSLVMVLLHISPKWVSVSQLTSLAGYSKSSGYIFKSKVIEALESEKVVEISKPYQRLVLVRLHQDNDLMQKFSSVCQEEGLELTENLLAKLLEEKR